MAVNLPESRVFRCPTQQGLFRCRARFWYHICLLHHRDISSWNRLICFSWSVCLPKPSNCPESHKNIRRGTQVEKKMFEVSGCAFLLHSARGKPLLLLFFLHGRFSTFYLISSKDTGLSVCLQRSLWSGSLVFNLAVSKVSILIGLLLDLNSESAVDSFSPLMVPTSWGDEDSGVYKDGIKVVGVRWVPPLHPVASHWSTTAGNAPQLP